MTFFREFFRGLGNCFRGFTLAFEKGLWPYFFYPLVIYVLLWITGIYGMSALSTFIAAYISDLFHFENIADSGDALSFAKPFLTGYFRPLLALIIRILFWFVSGTLLKYILLIALSPLLALLSAAAEEKLTGIAHAFSFPRFIRDLFRGIAISLRNMLLEYLCLAGCFFVSLLFPPLAVVTVPLSLFISWYFFGFTMLDYNFERHRMGIRQSARFARSHMGLACGIGLLYAFFMSLPGFLGSIIGIMLGPMLAVTGATKSFLEIKHSTVNRI